MGIKTNSLTTKQAAALHQKFGYNELPESHQSLAAMYLRNFWGPLPWLLELTIIISFLSGNKVEGIVIATLLIINSGISIYQRRSADKALTILRSNLQILARVRRDDIWTSLSASELVPGDIIRLRVGDIISADAELIDGALSVDLSSLTGESLPRDVTKKDLVFSGSVVRHGEATALVSNIGTNTKYGLTTQLLEIAHPPTHMENIIFSIIKYFSIINVILAVVVIIFGIIVHAPVVEISNFVIVLLLMSIPVAFPTMFAVAQSYGAMLLSKRSSDGVLVRRLAAIQDIAMMDVLCCDKTGTLTQNNLSVQAVTCYGSFDKESVLSIAGAACDEADQDYIDVAILKQIHEQKLEIPRRISFSPFDSSTKQTGAVINQDGKELSIYKGMPELLLNDDIKFGREAKRDLGLLSGKGLRIIAVISGDTCAGLIGLSDPIRSDAPKLIKEIEKLGIRVVMITGDGRVTASTVAGQLGLNSKVVTPDELKTNPSIAASGTIFAETYPEDKINIIRALQEAGHIVGMTGDGVNDAPALHQAEVGIAVAGATDVAKQSASLILTTPGLEGIRKAVNIGRGVSVRIRTWALNKIIKSIEVTVLTTVLFIVLHSYILSPLLAVLLMLANDFVTISIATDNAKPTAKPVRWNILHMIMAATIIAIVPLVIVFITYFTANYLNYPLDVVRTAIYLSLVYYGKSTLLAIRAWPHTWSVRPSKTLVIALLVSFLFALAVSVSGFIIPAIPILFVIFIVVMAIVNLYLVDLVKNLGTVKHLLGE
ncbi:MAG TPA: HAD-IC family P-type ATPase [Candidatus Saccharimonadales bacterium]|nr:HAD-IC family P-type ATPase [Candidatus Saccharimonadales bacterium]